MKYYLKYLYILLLGFNICFAETGKLNKLSENFKENILNLSQAISTDLCNDKNNLDKLLKDVSDFFAEFELFKKNLNDFELQELNEKIILLNEKLKEINTLDFVKNNKHLEQDITEQITRLELLDLKLADAQGAGIQQADAQKIDAVKTGFYQKTVKFLKDHKKVSALFLAALVSGFYFVHRFNKPEDAKNSENNPDDIDPENHENLPGLNNVNVEQPEEIVPNNAQETTDQPVVEVAPVDKEELNKKEEVEPVITEPVENNFQEPVQGPVIGQEILAGAVLIFMPEERENNIQVSQEPEQIATSALWQKPENIEAEIDERKYSRSGRELVRSPLADEIYKRKVSSPRDVRRSVSNIFGPGPSIVK